MEDQIQHLTRDGFRKFEAELNYLRTVRRSEVAERLRIALEEGGDLVENAEYDDAKNEQAFIEGRIQQLEMLLSRASIIEDEAALASVQDNVIRLSSVVTVQEEGYEPETFRIVGPAEANPAAGKISDVSPVGSALLGKRVGETVTIEAPDGSFTYRIVSISL
ncbi:MAG: transcription elongation factor GreA [Anaerolineae bacterium]|nr:transcription elongation factor GreA [Anaerolineae bacterium]